MIFSVLSSLNPGAAVQLLKSMKIFFELRAIFEKKNKLNLQKTHYDKSFYVIF